MENNINQIEQAILHRKITRMEIYSITYGAMTLTTTTPRDLPLCWSDLLVKRELLMQDPLVRSFVDSLKKHKKQEIDYHFETLFAVFLFDENGKRVFSLFTDRAGTAFFINHVGQKSSPALASWVRRVANLYFPNK